VCERVLGPEDEDGDPSRIELDPENAQRGPEWAVGNGRIHDRRLEAGPPADPGGLGAKQAGALPRRRLQEVTGELAELGPVRVVARREVLDGDERGGRALGVADARAESRFEVGRPAFRVANRDDPVREGLVQPVGSPLAVAAPAARRQGDEQSEGGGTDPTAVLGDP
jgi:hypothetical protein